MIRHYGDRVFFLRMRRRPRSTRIDPLFTYAALFRAAPVEGVRLDQKLEIGVARRLTARRRLALALEAEHGPVLGARRDGQVDGLAVGQGDAQIGRAHV